MSTLKIDVTTTEMNAHTQANKEVVLGVLPAGAIITNINFVKKNDFDGTFSPTSNSAWAIHIEKDAGFTGGVPVLFNWTNPFNETQVHMPHFLLGPGIRDGNFLGHHAHWHTGPRVVKFLDEDDGYTIRLILTNQFRLNNLGYGLRETMPTDSTVGKFTIIIKHD